MSKPPVVVINQKSVMLALILTLFFGPFGMMYSTILGGLVMLVFTSLVGVFTGGVGLFFMWPLQLLWAGMAASNYNKRQINAARRI